MSESNINEPENVETKKTRKHLKNNIIIFEFLIIIALTIFILFTTIKSDSDLKKEELLTTVINVQDNLSYYLGKMSADTFSLYSNTEILLGKKEETDEDIVATDEEKIEPLIDVNSKMEKNGKVGYKIIAQNMIKTLKVEIPDMQGITLYIQDGTKVKVNFDTTKPSWWTTDMDFLILGNN